jgi:nucleoside triphosphate diphosphatase
MPPGLPKVHPHRKVNGCSRRNFPEGAMRSRKDKRGKKRTVKSAGHARKQAKPQPSNAGDWFAKLVAVQARLRAPNGCPWDREQTHQTLRTYLIEEAYEVLEALDSGDDAKFAEEMGDLLLQIVFHSQIATEEGRFTVSDVIREIHDKMIRRHPHVFGELRAKDSAEVLRNWEQIKAHERRLKQEGSKPAPKKTAAEPSLLDGVSHALPATLEGFQLTRKAARIGFDWENTAGVIEKLAEETEELKKALATKNARNIEEEVGDLLFAAINLSRSLNTDPEIALKKANAKFSRRFRAMEQAARASGREFKELPRQEMEALWDAAKKAETSPREPAPRRAMSKP